MVTVFVGKGRDIPIHECISIDVKSRIEIRVNNVHFGTTAKAAGRDPSFMQEFQGEVRADTGTLISLLLYQQQQQNEVLLGYVAVPLERVLQRGREEGWYDLSSGTARSDQDSRLLHGMSGASEILLSFTGSLAVRQDLLESRSPRHDDPEGMENVLQRANDHEARETGRVGFAMTEMGELEYLRFKKRVLEVSHPWSHAHSLHAPQRRLVRKKTTERHHCR
jgi:hypothetical protein